MKKTIASFAVAVITAIGSTTSFASTEVLQSIGVTDANYTSNLGGIARSSSTADNLACVSRSEFTCLQNSGTAPSAIEFKNMVTEHTFATNSATSSGMVCGTGLTVGTANAGQHILSVPSN